MGFFKRRDKVIDLTKGYEARPIRQDEDIKDLSVPSSTSNSESASGGFFNLFGNTDASSSSNTNVSTESAISEESFGASEKRKRLAKRLTDMTDKMEDLSNQIYLLQQRIEVLERKTGTGRYN